MGKIFCIMGKSASGKDSIFKEIKDGKINLKTIIPYTTRPMRDGEEEGREYFFVGEEYFSNLKAQKKIVESRTYATVHGDWTYFMAEDGQIDLEKNSYILIGTLESCLQLKKYYGEEKVVPLYIEVEDGIRLQRALDRERQEKNPKYEELCRRFLADAKDFSEVELNKAGIQRRFTNSDREKTVEEIMEYIENNR